MSTLFAWPPVTAQQQTKPIPAPKASPIKNASEPERWYDDPRWWGIGATGALSLLSLFLQAVYRRADKKSDAASQHFDGDIRDPIKDSYKELRTLSTLVAVSAETDDATGRSLAIRKLRYETSCTTLNLFSMVLVEADRRLSLRGDFADINAALEDVLYISLGEMAKCDEAADRRRMAKKISIAISNAIVDADKKLAEQRKIYISGWN